MSQHPVRAHATGPLCLRVYDLWLRMLRKPLYTCDEYLQMVFLSPSPKQCSVATPHKTALAEHQDCSIYEEQSGRCWMLTGHLVQANGALWALESDGFWDSLLANIRV